MVQENRLNSEQKKKIIVVCGPTASGKSALAVEIALKFGGEIVSADSVSVYKGLDIGSAKPSEEEKRVFRIILSTSRRLRIRFPWAIMKSWLFPPSKIF